MASRYLIYAIGEIALVVIGILIALQINNWNENQNEKTQIKTYLSGLLEALDDDMNYLNYTLIGNTFRANCVKKMLLWSKGKTPKAFPEIAYKVDENWDTKILDVGWTNIWMDSSPGEYNRSFVEECFNRTTYGNIIVVNQSTLEEFKNTGLFSYIGSEDLKRQINDYYASINWHFSNWRESSYRGKIDKWELFLRDNYQTSPRDISNIQDPIDFIKKNRDVELELKDFGSEAAGRVNSAGKIREAGEELIKAINLHIQKM